MKALFVAVSLSTITAASLAHAAAPPSIGGSTPQAALDVEAQAERIDKQLNGDFGKLERNALDPLGMIQRAWDRAPGDAGHYTIPFDPNATPKLRARLGMPLTIILPEGERIPKDGVVLGADFLTEKYRNANRIVFLPSAVGMDGAVTIMGASGRTYPFYVRTESYVSNSIPDLVVHFAGPPITPLTPTDPTTASPAALPDLGNPQTAAKLNFAYSMAGEPSLAPDIVYSNGVWTFMQWSAERWKATDLPQVYRVVDGVDEPVPTPEVVGTTLIVKETGPLSLRSGKRYVCIRETGAKPSDRPAYARPVAEAK